MSTPPPITRSGAQHDAEHELSKAIYHRNADPLPVRAVKWFGHLIDRFLSSTLNHAPAGNFGALALIVLVVVILVVIVWRVGVPRRAGSVGSVLTGNTTLTAAEHRHLAAQAADRRDWHTAVIERMRALARELEERSVLDARAGRTATELAGEAAVALPVAAASLQLAASTFNRIAYGGGDATEADLAALVRADDSVRQSSRSMVVAG